MYSALVQMTLACVLKRSDEDANDDDEDDDMSIFHTFFQDKMALHVEWLLFLAPLIFLLYFLLTKKAENNNKTINLPSGPKALPIIGNLHQLGTPLHRSLWTLSQKHGPLMHLKLGFRPVLVVTSSDMAREVLKTHDLDFCSRPKLLSWGKYAYNYSDVSLSPYGESWRQMRKICILELFSAKRMETFRFVREEEVSLMVQSIAAASDTSKPINVNKEMASLGNGIISRVAFGKKLEGNFATILDQFEENLGTLYLADYFPVLGYWIDKISGRISKMEKNIVKLDAIYEEILRDHLHSKKTRDDHEDIVDVLLRSEKDDGRVTMENVKGVLMDMFIAGTQTVSSTVVWAMAELARDPNSMKKAQEEIKLHVKQNQSRIHEEDLNSLQYIKSIVKETLRLHAPVPLLVPREVMQDCKIEGYDIMEKTIVYVNAWAIGRDPKTWDRAEEFIPDRFLNSSIDYKGHDFEFIPFGSGRRICPAMNTGITVVELALANLLYCFDWVLPCGVNREDIDMGDGPGISLQKKTPLQLVAIKKANLI